MRASARIKIPCSIAEPVIGPQSLLCQWPGPKYSYTSNETTEVCLDTGCSVTLIDRAYLKQALPDANLMKMSAPMPVRGVGNKIIKTDEYVQIEIFVPGATAAGSFIMGAHIVDDLMANMLIGIDNLEPRGISIDFNTATYVLEI